MKEAVCNEKGVIYPITFCLFILFTTFFLVMINLYLNKKQMVQETKAVYRQDYYLMSTVKVIEKKLSNGEEFPLIGSYVYPNGTVSYKITKYSPTLEKVEYNFKANPNYHIWGMSYFDKEQKKMTKWLELK
ncbi:competence type IV pilus minor pilin ComGG [Niallia sp. 03133]|uniref:competence type IV pilus minor pilin ComGG n=1 Tax=Niallia sp. 03133 TaxID=3458060 RepID=UPI004044F4B2